MWLAAGGKTGSASQLSAHWSRMPLPLEMPPVPGNRKQYRARAHLVSFTVQEDVQENVQVAGFVRVAWGLV